MAFNKKKKRHITVADQRFYWSATGGDGTIKLMIMTEIEGSGKLLCYFDYHQDWVAIPCVPGSFSASNQFVITPYTVRQVIEYGLQNGWKPFEKSPNVSLGSLDEKIDLRLNQNRENNFREAA